MKIPVWEAVIIIGHINLISWKKEDIKKLILDIYSANNIYKILHLVWCLTLFLISLDIVLICVYFEKL